MPAHGASPPQVGYPAAVPASAPPAAYGAPPPIAPPPNVARGATQGVVIGEVICPSCRLPTMTTPGVASVCFSCGQPLGAPVASDAPKGYALTGALPSALAPPVDPYGASSARLVGAAGDFPVTVAEAAVGRDPAKCRVVLTEPRVSGVHAHVRLLDGAVQVRDGGSNNGTYVDGARIPAEVWVSVRVGAELRFGPVTFTVMR